MTLKMLEIKFLTHLWGVISSPYIKVWDKTVSRGSDCYVVLLRTKYTYKVFIGFCLSNWQLSLCVMLSLADVSSYLPSKIAMNADQHKIINSLGNPMRFHFCSSLAQLCDFQTELSRWEHHVITVGSASQIDRPWQGRLVRHFLARILRTLPPLQFYPHRHALHRDPVCFPNIFMVIVFLTTLNFNEIESKLKFYEHPKKVVSVRLKWFYCIKKMSKSLKYC